MAAMNHKLHIGGGAAAAPHRLPEIPSPTAPLPPESTADGSRCATPGGGFNFLEEEYQVQLSFALSASDRAGLEGLDSVQMKAAAWMSIGAGDAPVVEHLSFRYWVSPLRLGWDEKPSILLITVSLLANHPRRLPSRQRHLLARRRNRLPLDAPLLSDRRRFSAPPVVAVKKTPPSPSPRRSTLPLYKPELNFTPARERGVVPFAWEKAPGQPKHSPRTALGRGYTSDRPPVPPKPPPGSTGRVLSVSGSKNGESGDDDGDVGDEDEQRKGFRDAVQLRSKSCRLIPKLWSKIPNCFLNPMTKMKIRSCLPRPRVKTLQFESLHLENVIYHELEDQELDLAEEENGNGTEEASAENWKRKSSDDLQGIECFEKGKGAYVVDVEFGESKALHGRALIGKDQVMYGAPELRSFDAEAIVRQSVLCGYNTEIPETNDPS